MDAIGTYSPDDITVAWGEILVSGYAKGSMVKVGKPETKQVTSVQGGDGRIARSVRRHAPLRQVEINLLQTAECNQLFAGQAELDRITGQVVKPLTVKDGSGTTIYSFPQAWICERPDGEFGQEAGTRTWVLEGPCQESEGFNL